MKIFSGSSNRPLAEKVAKKLGLKLGEIELSRFDNDEARVFIKEKNVGDKCIVVSSLSEPTDHNLVELLLICDALKKMGAKEIIGVVPWLGYSKQDKVFREGEPLSIEVIAKILKVAGLSKLVTIDLHNEKIIDYFKIPVVNLSAVKILAKAVLVDKETVVVAPDKGAVSKSRELAKLLNCPVAIIDKERDLESGRVTIKGIKGNVDGKKAIIIDDMIATGGTLIKTASFLKTKGVSLVKVLATHHLQIKGVQEKLDQSEIDELVVTDTVRTRVKSSKLKVLSVAEMIVREIAS